MPEVKTSRTSAVALEAQHEFDAHKRELIKTFQKIVVHAEGLETELARYQQAEMPEDADVLAEQLRQASTSILLGVDFRDNYGNLLGECYALIRTLSAKLARVTAELSEAKAAQERAERAYENLHGVDEPFRTTIAELKRRLAECERALAPFALLGGPDDGCAAAFHDLADDVVIAENSGRVITAGDVRKARELTSKFYQPTAARKEPTK